MLDTSFTESREVEVMFVTHHDEKETPPTSFAIALGQLLESRVRPQRSEGRARIEHGKIAESHFEGFLHS